MPNLGFGRWSDSQLGVEAYTDYTISGPLSQQRGPLLPSG